jgi:signal transduction histidine kinase
VSTVSHSPLHAEAVLQWPEEDDLPTAPQPVATWRVLVVDDSDDVHRATAFALQDVCIEGGTLTLLHAHTAAEAFPIVANDEQIAVILLDVVMETPDAGLQLVRRIRQELGRVPLRIILRTGQPGYAPELETLRAYDINDYRTKDELTRTRLFTSLTAAIRTFKLLGETLHQRDELRRVNASLLQARAAEQVESARRAAAELALQRTNERIERRVEQRTEELSQAIAELESFNRIVSHDLRAPLHGLAGLSGLMQKELDAGNTTQLRRWLGMLEQQTRHMAHLVSDLLDLARVNKSPLERRPLSLQAVVADARATLAVSHAADTLACIRVNALPNVAGDERMLRQVFVNLLSNAIKFTRQSPHPQVVVCAESRGGEEVVRVVDNGVGFDARRAGDLFKPFCRLHGAEFEGAGIGLSIALRIIERHGGRIWAESTPGGGATFVFALPR